MASTELRAAAQQALEALLTYEQYIQPLTNYFGGPRVPKEGSASAKVEDAITALRAALAEPVQEPQGCDHCNHPLYAAVKCRVCGRVTEPVQEPVVNHYESDLDMVKCRQIAREYAWPNSNIDSGNLYWALHVALRRIDAAQPQRKPLTEEELQAAWDSVDMRHPRGNETRIAFARAIERAHKIGGQP